MTRAFRIAAALLAGLACCSPLSASFAQPRFTFGVSPQHSVSVLAKTWTPVLSFLSAQTGYQIGFETGKDIEAYNRRVRAGEFDFAYVAPNLYIAARQAQGYLAFAKEKEAMLRGLLVVRTDSPVRGLRDLARQPVAFASPLAFGASVLQQAYFVQEKVPVTPVYVGSHESVYRAVAKGLYPAGGGIERTLDAAPPEVRRKLRVLWLSEPYPPLPIAAHPRVPREVVQRLLDAMLRMDQSAKGRELLTAIQFKGIVAATDVEYDAVRRLKIPVPEMQAK